MNTIIAAIDFSDVSPKVLEQATSLATLTGSKLHVVHAAAPNPDFIGFEAGPQNERDFRAETLSNEHEELNKIAAQLKDRGIIASATLRQGPTAQTLLEEAEACKASLIVMGSHGHGALFSLVAGSATMEVLKGSKIPVLVVPARA